MRQSLFNYAVTVAALVSGILGGLLPPPPVAALWTVGILDALLAAWFLVHVYGWGRGGIYAVVAVTFSFGAEYVLINGGILTHFARPQPAGVAVLNLLQDFFAVAAPYIFACALLPNKGVPARAFGAAAIMLITTIVGGPFATTLDYYTYNEPFLAWGKGLGLSEVPAVPWAEPVGMFVLAMATTLVFAATGSMRGERRRFSPKWAALLYFHGQVLPGWAWAAYTGRWELFALDTVLLAGLAAFALRAVTTGTDVERPRYSCAFIVATSSAFLLGGTGLLAGELRPVHPKDKPVFEGKWDGRFKDNQGQTGKGKYEFHKEGEGRWKVTVSWDMDMKKMQLKGERLGIDAMRLEGKYEDTTYWYIGRMVNGTLVLRYLSIEGKTGKSGSGVSKLTRQK